MLQRQPFSTPNQRLPTAVYAAPTFSSTGSPRMSHAFHPPTRALAPIQPAFLSSRVTRTLVCSSIQAQ
jgi:hypothetical protein